MLQHNEQAGRAVYYAALALCMLLLVAGWAGAAGDVTSSLLYQTGNDLNSEGSILARETTTSPALVMPAADLLVTQAGEPDTVLAGQILSYRISVANNGPDTATNIVVHDMLPPGVMYLSAGGAGSDCSYASGNITCTLSDLSAGETQDIPVIVAAPAGGGTITNTALVISAAEDPDMTNNSAAVETTVMPVADLGVAIASVNPPSLPGDSVALKVSLTNYGPSDAVGVRVMDVLPAGLVYVTDTSGGSYDFTSGVWNIGAVTAGATVSMTVKALLNQAGGLHPTVSTADSDNYDPDLSDNSYGFMLNTGVMQAANWVSDGGSAKTGNPAEQIITMLSPALPHADLSVIHSASAAAVSAGQQMKYILKVTNHGPDSAKGIVLSNTLPAGATFVNVSWGEGWNCNRLGFAVTCTLGSLDVGTAPDITIVANAPNQAGTLLNTASVTASVADPDMTNNNASTSTAVSVQTNLKAPKGVMTVSDSAFPELQWRIVWINDSNSISMLTRVSDPIPSGLSYLPHSLSCEARGSSTTIGCSYDALQQRVVWEGTIAPDQGVASETGAYNAVIINFRTLVGPGVARVANQSFACWDSDGEGLRDFSSRVSSNKVVSADDFNILFARAMDSRTYAGTDDPKTPEAGGDATVWARSANGPAVSVPTLNEWGLIFFAVFAGLLSVYFLRRIRAVK